MLIVMYLSHAYGYVLCNESFSEMMILDYLPWIIHLIVCACVRVCVGVGGCVCVRVSAGAFVHECQRVSVIAHIIKRASLDVF